MTSHLLALYADDSQNPGRPGDLVAQYEYDGTNCRVEKQVTQAGGGPRHVHYFYNHDWQVLEERFVDDQGTPVAINQYVWSQRYIDAPIVRLHDGNADGDLTDTEDNQRYYTGDANYNVTATIPAATGNVLERYVYTAYGTATVYDADWSNPTAPTTSGPLYCGYFFDSETGLYHVRNRYYDASLSAFVTRDLPITRAAGRNLYRYCANDPLSRVDPRGRWWWDDDWIQMGIGGLIGFYGPDVAAEGWSHLGGGLGDYVCDAVIDFMGWPLTECLVEIVANADVITDIIALATAELGPQGPVIAKGLAALADCAANGLTTLKEFCQGKCPVGLRDIVLTTGDCFVDFMRELSGLLDVFWMAWEDYNRDEDLVSHLKRLDKCFELAGRPHFVI